MESLAAVAVDNGGVDTVKRKFDSDVFLTPVSDGVINAPLVNHYRYVKCVKSAQLTHLFRSAELTQHLFMSTQLTQHLFRST